MTILPTPKRRVLRCCHLANLTSFKVSARQLHPSFYRKECCWQTDRDTDDTRLQRCKHPNKLSSPKALRRPLSPGLYVHSYTATLARFAKWIIRLCQVTSLHNKPTCRLNWMPWQRRCSLLQNQNLRLAMLKFVKKLSAWKLTRNLANANRLCPL